VRLRVNGVWQEVSASASTRPLLSWLRDDLRLTGTKQACTIGVCGLCSVLLDGELVSACLILPAAIDGADVTTVEGVKTSIPYLLKVLADPAFVEGHFTSVDGRRLHP